MEGFTWREYDAAMCRTTEGIQRYVVAPEVTLLTLRDDLTKLHGVHCELFPRFDAYDMLISLPSGKKWAVDMKDHRDPARLGGSLKPFSTVPAWDNELKNHQTPTIRLNGLPDDFPQVRFARLRYSRLDEAPMCLPGTARSKYQGIYVHPTISRLFYSLHNMGERRVKNDGYKLFDASKSYANPSTV